MPRARIHTTSPPSESRRPRSSVLLVSCYELGHQPLAVASAAAFLGRAGHDVETLDLAVEPQDRLGDPGDMARFDLFAVSVPMHTALHIGVRAAARIRRSRPDAHLCFFGLYASLNADHLLTAGADSVGSGEFEETLVALADALAAATPLEEVAGLHLRQRPAAPVLRRLDFPVPERGRLPAPDRYARLEHRGQRIPAAAVEASRGCLHRCRHCPIPPVYGGRFFVVPREIVLDDLRGLARAGVGHVSFADPDFFNGPGHSMAIVRQAHRELPRLTFDVTTKIEHILRHRDKLDELSSLGCLFVVSAVESLSDEVLTQLDKGHSREDVRAALDALRAAGIALRPSFVAFTPWTRIEDYLDVLDWVEEEELVDGVDPVQYSIRLLVPPGSALVELPSMRPHLRTLDPSRFCWVWEHPDPRMDRLHRDVAEIVRIAAVEGRATPATFSRIRDLAAAAAGHRPRPSPVLPARIAAPAPRLTEPWFC